MHRTRTAGRRPHRERSPFLVIHSPRNIVTLFLLAAVALMLGLGASVAPASAKGKPPCWKTLINDWYDGRIDGTYPIHCYREALQHLPTDVDTYSSAREDIKQALQKRITQGTQTRDDDDRQCGPPGPAAATGTTTAPAPRTPAATDGNDESPSGPVQERLRRHQTGQRGLRPGAADRARRGRPAADGGRRDRLPHPPDAHAPRPARLGRSDPAWARQAATPQ